MFRVTSLTQVPDQQLNRWIKRIALLVFVVFVAFAAFYAIDRFRMPAAPIVDRELAQLEEAVRTATPRWTSPSRARRSPSATSRRRSPA